MRAAGPGPSRGPGTGGALLKSSLFEQPTKSQGRVGGSIVQPRGNEPEEGVTPLLHGLHPLPGGITPPSSRALSPLEPLAGPSLQRRTNQIPPHAAPKFADSIHPPPLLLGLPVYVVTLFHYLFLALISEAFILPGIGRVSTASFRALKRSLCKPGLGPSGDRALV